MSSKEVLTAAHCTSGATAAYVVLGEHDLTKADGEKKVRVRKEKSLTMLKRKKTYAGL